jgi:hypothetical protein
MSLFPRGFALALLLGLLAAPYATAKQHPVPLDPKTDSAKCIECHANKAKGKAVHSAIATGCLSCHEIRSVKDVTRVKLTTTISALGALALAVHELFLVVVTALCDERHRFPWGR